MTAAAGVVLSMTEEVVQLGECSGWERLPRVNRRRGCMALYQMIRQYGPMIAAADRAGVDLHAWRTCTPSRRQNARSTGPGT